MSRSSRIALGLVGTVIFLLVLAVIVIKVVFTKERVLAMLTPQLERVIDRPVSVADAGITLWNGIGVRLDGITVGNASGFTDEPMLAIGRLGIKARFWPLLSGRVVIDRIVVSDSYVLVEFDNEGKSNFEHLIKTDTLAAGPTTEDQKQRLTVVAIIVDNARLAWRDKRAAQWIDLYGADADAEIDAGSPPLTSFNSTLVFDSMLVFQEERRLAIRAGHPSLYVNGSWNKSTRLLTLDSTVTEWWGARLSADGQVRFLPAVKEIALNARLASVRVEELIREMKTALPLEKLTDLTAAMSGSFDARFVWPLPDNTVPDWQGRFELIDVNWPLPETKAVVSIPRVEIRGADRSVSWSASSGEITGGTFSTSGTIDELFTDQKTFSGRLQANMPLGDTRGLLPDKWRSALSGTLSLDVSGFGNVDDWRNLNANGRIHSDGLTMTDADWDFDSVSAVIDCQLTGHGLRLSQCAWVAGDSRGGLSGSIENIIPAALSGFSTPDVPHGQFDLVSPFLNLDRLIGDEEPVDTIAPSAGEAEKLPLLSITGNLTVDTLLYNGLTISTVQSKYAYKDRVFSLSPIAGQVFGGTIDGRLDWNLNTWPSPEFFTSLSASGIESNDFFTRYLGWAGGIYGQMSMSGEFAGKGRVASQIIPTLLAQGRIDLSEARLESAPLLAGIGRAIGIAGLDRPRNLRDLRAPFRVQNGRVITDDLRVTWDEVAYRLEGSFGLDQTLAYNVTATAVGERAPQVVRGTGLRFLISGTALEPSVRLDAVGIARDVRDKAVDQAKDTLQKTLESKLKDFLSPKRP